MDAGTARGGIFLCPDHPAHPGVAVAPCGGSAAIFNWFQGGTHDHYGHDAELVAQVAGYLKTGEHYRVQVYGGKGDPPATLASFVKMASEGVVIFDVHGFDPSTAGRDCTDAKGLFRVYGVSSGPVVCQMQQPGLLVETDPSAAAQASALARYRAAGFSSQELEPFAGKASGAQDKGIFYEHQKGENPCVGGSQGAKGIHYVPGDLCGLMLTATGIRRVFAKHHLRLVIAVACHSLSFARYRASARGVPSLGSRGSTWKCVRNTSYGLYVAMGRKASPPNLRYCRRVTAWVGQEASICCVTGLVFSA